MKAKFLVGLGIFLLLGGVLASELGLHFLTKRIPILSPSYRGWGEPDFYRLSREDSNTAHRWIMFLKLNGVVCLVGFTILHLQLRRRNGTGSVNGIDNSAGMIQRRKGIGF